MKPYYKDILFLALIVYVNGLRPTTELLARCIDTPEIKYYLIDFKLQIYLSQFDCFERLISLFVVLTVCTLCPNCHTSEP